MHRPLDSCSTRPAALLVLIQEAVGHNRVYVLRRLFQHRADHSPFSPRPGTAQACSRSVASAVWRTNFPTIPTNPESTKLISCDHRVRHQVPCPLLSQGPFVRQASSTLLTVSAYRIGLQVRLFPGPHLVKPPEYLPQATPSSTNARLKLDAVERGLGRPSSSLRLHGDILHVA